MAKKMTATLKFRTLQARDWVLTKDFEDQKHIDNFIQYIHRTKGYMLDELWCDDERYVPDNVS